jgi:hypothetical protein
MKKKYQHFIVSLLLISLGYYGTLFAVPFPLLLVLCILMFIIGMFLSIMSLSWIVVESRFGQCLGRWLSPEDGDK